MQISSIAINDAQTQIDLQITDAADVSELRLWTYLTYKNFSQAIDLSGLLTGSATENIAITLSDISESEFDGIYFVEAVDNTAGETSIDFVYNIARYKECVVNEAVKLAASVSGCDSCLKRLSTPLLNVANLLEGLDNALQLRFIREAIKIAKTLDTFCNSKCASCGPYDSVTDNSSSDTGNNETVVVNIDGGSL